MRNIIVGFVGLLMVVSNAIAAEELNTPLPEFTLKNDEGGNVNASEFRGQVVLLNFWATWCRPCLEEMPVLDRLHNQYRESGFTVLGINIEDTAESNKFNEVKAFVRDRKVTFPILYDAQKHSVRLVEQQIMKRGMGLPTTLLIDRAGNARYLHEGYMPGDEDDYRQLVDQLVNE